MEKFEKAIKIFNHHNGIMHTKQALDAGIAPKTLYAMRDSGVITRLSRGLYALADLEPISNPDLVTVALNTSAAVFCLITALDFYNLTEQVPRMVYFALPQGARRPQIDYPPVKVVWPSRKIYEAGIQEKVLGKTPVKMYSPEKTIADCFKFRNKIGLDVAVDAIKRYLDLPAKEQDFNTLMGFAKLNQVDKIITPYLDALL